MNRRPVGASPRLQGLRLLRIGVDPSDDHGPSGVACIPRGRVFRHAADRSFDRVKVHEYPRDDWIRVVMWRRKSGQILGYNWLFSEREARWFSNSMGER